MKRLIVTADWWAELSPEGQSEYIAQHPNSKMARDGVAKKTIHHEKKQAKKSAQEKDAANRAKQAEEKREAEKKAAEAPKPVPFKEKLDGLLKHAPEAEQKFHSEGGAESGSAQRKTMAGHVTQHAKGVVSHLKSQGAEWKAGVGALRKLASKRELSHHDKEALKAITKDILITVGSVAVTGGLGHGVMLALGHFGFDLVKDCVLKATAHGIVSSSVHLAAKPDSDEQFMLKVIQQLAKFIESGKIPDAAWEKSIAQMAAKNKATKEAK